MQKKFLSLTVAIGLLATAAIGGTLAYFTDTDQATNVMVTGNVSIIQNEQQRAEDGTPTLEAFKDGKALYPATGDTNGDGKNDAYADNINGYTFVDENGETQTIKMINRPDENNVFSLNTNAVDKIITVTNDGDNEAYVRTLIAFEIPTMKAAKEIYGENNVPEYVTDLNKDGKYVDVVNMPHYLYTVMHEGATPKKGYTLPTENGEYIIITDVNGVSYLVTEYYYKNDSKLAAGKTTHPSLTQIYLSALATNEDAELVVGDDGQYNILAVSQAVQTAGFDNAEDAMKAAFGEVTAENAAKWILTNAPITPVLP